MAERGVRGASQIRLVRCPNCNKILPELPLLAAYRCGGCNAILQGVTARKQTPALGSSPERSDGGEIKFVGNLENGLDREPNSGSGFCAYESAMREPKASVFEATVKNTTSNVDELAKENIERKREKKMGIGYVDRDLRVCEKEALEGGERFRASIPREASKDQKMGIPFSSTSIEGRLGKYRRPTSRYANEDLNKKQSPAGTRRVDYLEQDPVELLRKLDELRDQITRSCEFMGKQREAEPRNRRAASSSFNHKHHSPWFSEEEQPPFNRINATRSHHLNRHDMGMPNFHSPVQSSNGIHGYQERYRRVPYDPYAEYAERPRDSYLYSQFDLDPVTSDQNYGFYHQPACSCLHCYQHLLPPGRVPPISISYQRAGNRGFPAADRSSLLSSENYDRRFIDSSLYSHKLQTQKRVSLRSKRVERLCRPIGGAAPFIICSNCFELLQLPSKIPHMSEKSNKLRCGSCSQAIIFELDEKVFAFSMTWSAVPMIVNNGSCNYRMNQNLQHQNVIGGNPVPPMISPEDDIHPADDDPVPPMRSHQMVENECGLNMSCSVKMQSPSTSSSKSRDVESLENMGCGETRDYRSGNVESQDLQYHKLIDGSSVFPHCENHDNPQDDLKSSDDNPISPAIIHQITEKERGSSMNFPAKTEVLSTSSSSSGDDHGETRECRSGDAENPDLHKHELSNGNSVLSHSKDYDSPRNEIHSTGNKLVSPTTDYQMTEKGSGLNMNYSTKMEVFSTSSIRSRDVECPGDLRCGQTRESKSTNVENQDLHCHENFDGNSVLAQSKVYDSIQDEIHSADDDPGSPAMSDQLSEKECGPNMNCSEKMEGCNTFSSRSGNEESPENIGSQRDSSSLNKLSFDAQVASYVFGLQKNSVHPFFSQDMDDFEDEIMSSNSGYENVVKGDLKQQSIEDAQLANEMDLSFTRYPYSGFSEGSVEVGHGEDQPIVGKSGNSFFAGLIKKSLKDFSLFNQSVESGRCKVSVNGHPISDRLLKKAEKKAGPIDPGAYWYDYRAGFWGVMGHECLGIIPSFIKEFKYPMPRNCADGNTGVLVNGRELNQKDLDLLVERGLQRTSRRSYIIEMSGKVLDEASGKELHNLGKLAPTVEILKRGFGMHAPKELS
ncbi:uncharacterized protein [Typha latifolia]|uniref:uncharacterized protein n=1 Tax=Typha latifolia TaxID=4733 RepID=UPI003C2D8D57